MAPKRCQCCARGARLAARACARAHRSARMRAACAGCRCRRASLWARGVGLRRGSAAPPPRAAREATLAAVAEAMAITDAAPAATPALAAIAAPPEDAASGAAVAAFGIRAAGADVEEARGARLVERASPASR